MGRTTFVDGIPEPRVGRCSPCTLFPVGLTHRHWASLLDDTAGGRTSRNGTTSRTILPVDGTTKRTSFPEDSTGRNSRWRKRPVARTPGTEPSRLTNLPGRNDPVANSPGRNEPLYKLQGPHDPSEILRSMERPVGRTSRDRTTLRNGPLDGAARWTRYPGRNDQVDRTHPAAGIPSERNDPLG